MTVSLYSLLPQTEMDGSLIQHGYKLFKDMHTPDTLGATRGTTPNTFSFRKHKYFNVQSHLGTHAQSVYCLFFLQLSELEIVAAASQSCDQVKYSSPVLIKYHPAHRPTSLTLYQLLI